MENFESNMPWVNFYLLNELYAISASYVKEMLAMPKVVKIPRTPEYIRGIINLRGRNFPVIDLRTLLGMKSFVGETNELVKLLEHREQDHKNWISELELSVKEHREFKLTTDPHKCTFGKWYDNFKTDNRVLNSLLKKFNNPHNIIHSIALKVEELVDKKKFDAAFDIINQTRDGELGEMIKLFNEFRTLLLESSREIALVLEWEEKAMVISVDSVARVEKLNKSNIEELSGSVSNVDNQFISGVGKHENANELVQLLDVEKLISHEFERISENIIV